MKKEKPKEKTKVTQNGVRKASCSDANDGNDKNCHCSLSFHVESVGNSIDEDVADGLFERYYDTANEFINVMMLHHGYSKLVSDVANRTTAVNTQATFQLLKEVLDGSAVKGRQNPVARLVVDVEEAGKACETHKYNIYDSDLAIRIQDLSKNYDQTTRILRETVLQQIVNTWELLLGGFLVSYYERNPSAFDGSRKIVVAKILNATTIEGARRTIVEDCLKEVLSGDINEQISHVKKLLNADIISNCSAKLFKSLKEVMLRRNVIVHCGGLVTIEYASRAKELIGESYKVDSHINIAETYLQNAWETVLLIGMILIFLVLSSRAQKVKDENLEERVVILLANSCSNMISNGKCHVAKDVLEFLNKRAIKSLRAQMLVKINLALAYKCCGKTTDLKKILTWFDHSGCEDFFRVGVEALRENYNEVYILLGRLANLRPDFIADVYGEPIFEGLRQQKDFPEKIKTIWPACDRVAKRVKIGRLIDSCGAIFTSSREK